MAKDPAALFYIDKWLVATKEMKSYCRGWFLNLILHQFDKGDLPNDLEELANLADVRISEFKMFKETFEQVLKHKFQLNSNNRLENAYAKEIIQAREVYKEKRGGAGKMSQLVQYLRRHLTKDENLILFIKKNIDLSSVDLSDKQKIQHMFKHLYELYINVNENVNINKDLIHEGGVGETLPVVTSVEIPEARFMVDDEPINDIREFLESNFQILMNDLKAKYGELIFKSALEEFERSNLQHHWPSLEKLRHHFTNFIRKHDEIKRKNGGNNYNQNGTESISNSINEDAGVF